MLHVIKYDSSPENLIKYNAGMHLYFKRPVILQFWFDAAIILYGNTTFCVISKFYKIFGDIEIQN